MIPKISILMLTHDAPEYVDRSIKSINRLTHDIAWELIVVDNLSSQETRDLVVQLHEGGFINKLKLLDYNSLFAEGNNIAHRMASDEATHFLLLNSDIEVLHPLWLSRLLNYHERGIVTYGVCRGYPTRVDGYCLLIDADLYRRYLLDERHQWWWAVTKLQARVLQDGWTVSGFPNHDQYLRHFGGKSGTDFRGAKGMNVTREEAGSWFGDKTITILAER